MNKNIEEYPLLNELVVENEDLKKEIETSPKLTFNGFKVFNTSWAKSRVNGQRDSVNLALFIELENNDKLGYWLISEREIKDIVAVYAQVRDHNMKYDREGMRFRGLLVDEKEVDNMDADEHYGLYLKGIDLKEDIDVTIKSVELEDVGEKEKLVVSFNELKKALVLNKTNKDRIKEQFNTSETDEWVGKSITLTTEPAVFKGEEGPAIRVKKQPEAE